MASAAWSRAWMAGWVLSASLGASHALSGAQEPVREPIEEREDLEPTEAERVRWASLADRLQYEDGMSQELDKAEEEIEEIEQGRAISLTQEQLQLRRESVEELKDLLDDARDALDQLTGVDGDAWLLARRELELETGELWTAISETKGLLGLT